ncbi:nucleoside 2-deoxyribosyltransferase [bacterium]|nr:nucleoside 2-deoxyribosyltransferase [bacterium]MCB2179121.1 nucleoside 2-deoxyribosyltransferase [bacterium]
MIGKESALLKRETADATGPYTIYSAGGLFMQHELATNVLIKEAVWRLSDGKFQLNLPQSREMQELDQDNIEAYIRNDDLLQVITADILLARFDGLELDSGTVVEYMMAKFLGKPTVILRTDFRSVSFLPECEPYNSMVKNWPRTVEIHLHSYMIWAGLMQEEHQVLGDNPPPQSKLKTELDLVQKSVDEIAIKIIAGIETVLEMESPYPPEYQEVVYQAARYSLGCGFDQMLTANELEQTIQRFRKNGTL